jgi:hypothetical protein
LSRAHVAVSGATTIRPLYSTVEWEGKEYDAREGTVVLMQVIVDARTDASRRVKALERLGRLRNTDTTEQLVALYDRVTEREERLETIRCLISSEDPRGFSLFMQVLEDEKDPLVRIFAAVALAQWNIRRGVAELMGVLDECRVDASADRTACNEAAKGFLSLNARKGWGFPEERIRQEILARPDVSDEEMSALFVVEMKKWFAENERRFPDWKLGDPLPKVTPRERDDPMSRGASKSCPPAAAPDAPDNPSGTE